LSDDSLAVCGAVFAGNRALGEGCGSANECADGDNTACYIEGDSGCGTCESLPLDGQSCINLECAAGLVCTFATETCTPAPGEGDSCADAPCGDDLLCNDSDLCEVKVTPTQGATCPDRGCDPFATGLACRATSNTCEPITAVQPGDVCDVGFEVGRYCINQSTVNRCVDEDDDGVGVCTPRAAVGEPCVVTDCVDDAVCDPTSRECVAAPVAGAACVDGECAAEAYCDVATDECVARRQVGEGCSTSDECVEGAFCDIGDTDVCVGFGAPDAVCPA
jgi:hypothetical protein